MALSRRRKLVLFLVLTPVLLVVLLVVAVFLPTVQTAAARRVLAGQGGEVERVAVGLGGAELSGFTLTQPGLKLSVPSFRADAPLTALAGGRLALRGLVAKDIVIEIDPSAQATEPVPAKDPAADKPFAGVLGEAQLAGVQIEGLDLAGRIRVLGPQPVEATFTLTGGGVRAGQTGQLELKVEAKDGLGSVVTRFTLAPKIGADGRLDALGAVAEAFAQSALLASPARLRATVDITRQAAGEAYALRLLAGETPLVELDTQWAPGATELPGRWKIALRDEDLAPFTLGLALPELTLEGAGELALLGADKLRVGGRFDFAGDHLETLGLPALGPVTLRSRFAVEVGTVEARVESLQLELAGAAPVLAVETRQVFAVESATKRLVPTRPETELAEIRLLGVPPAWVKLFVPELTLAGPVSGAWTVRPEGDGFVVDSSQPFVAGGVGYAAEGRPLVAFEAVRVEGLRAKQTSSGLEASIGRLRVLVDGADLVSATLEAKQPAGGALQAKGELRAVLARLVDQPALRGQTRLSGGEALVSFEATLAETVQALAKVRLGGLRAAGAGDLPEVLLEADLTRSAAGVLSVKAPLTVTNVAAKRSSDLRTEATLTPGADGQRIVARLGSQVLFLEDLQAFAALATTSSAPQAPAPTTKTGGPEVAPAGPLWAGTTGEVELDLARIVYAPGVETSARGKIALSPEAATLESLKAELGTGGVLGAKGALHWSSAEKNYLLAADVKGEKVAVGPLLQALKPSEAPKLEGTYDLTASVSGSGADPGLAAEGAAVEVKLTGTQGRLRVLDFETGPLARLASGPGGTVLGLLGAVTGDSGAGQVVGYASAALAITKQLSNLAYDEISLEARRGADGAVEIGRLAVLSPQLRLVGGGGLRAVPGRSFWEQPMQLRMQLGAGGEFARELERLKLLRPLAPEAAEAATGAFREMKTPLIFDGTPLKIGTEQALRIFLREVGL